MNKVDISWVSMQKGWLTDLKILPFMPSANSSKLDLQYAADESENVQILAMNVHWSVPEIC
jgi:hypothetical protein